jgi:hypothetical protein
MPSWRAFSRNGGRTLANPSAADKRRINTFTVSDAIQIDQAGANFDWFAKTENATGRVGKLG